MGLRKRCFEFLNCDSELEDIGIRGWSLRLIIRNKWGGQICNEEFTKK